MPEQVLPDWQLALQLGQLNEDVVAHELHYNGIPFTRTDPNSKEPFDGHFSDGKSCEIKLDLRSQGTKSILLEQPTYNRAADVHIHTITYAKVFTREEVEYLYSIGRAVHSGDYMYNSRAVPLYEIKNVGVYLHDFIKQLKTPV